MIRAMIHTGQKHPTDPHPAPGRTEGRRLNVEDAGSTPADDPNSWHQGWDELGPAPYVPGEWVRFPVLDENS